MILNPPLLQLQALLMIAGVPCKSLGNARASAPGLGLLHVCVVGFEFAVLMLQPGVQLRQVALDLVDVFLHTFAQKFLTC